MPGADVFCLGGLTLGGFAGGGFAGGGFAGGALSETEQQLDAQDISLRPPSPACVKLTLTGGWVGQESERQIANNSPSTASTRSAPTTTAKLATTKLNRARKKQDANETPPKAQGAADRSVKPAAAFLLSL